MKIKKKIILFLVSLLLTLLFLRISLSFFPSTNLTIGSYNIHHLYLGSFLIIIAVILLLFEIVNTIVVIVSGLSSALILDELIYLIATDGSDVSYLSTVSLTGTLIVTFIILIMIGFLYYGKFVKKRNKK
ncbi:MAG: hypothetical protein Q8R37_05275 [Nanoarchaeota archaeon]|nr:hypothetical protein [Nanoarchaeota archaeon]